MKEKNKKADILLVNGIIITMNSRLEIIEGDIAIYQDTIVAIGPDLKEEYNSTEIVEVHKNIIMPGLINTHGHAAMSLFRGFVPDCSVQEWLKNYILPAEMRYVNPEFVYWGTKLSCLEMIASGTTCFVDSYYFEDLVAQAAYSMHMRAVVGQTIHDLSTPDVRNSNEGLAKAEQLIEKWKNNRLIKPAVAPHSVYACQPKTLKSAQELADNYQVPLLMHCAESKDENSGSLFSYLEKLGLLETHLLAAHAIYINQLDMDIIKNYKIGIAHCPVSNMKLGSGIAPIAQMFFHGIETIGFGTDSPASNNSLDMFAEIKTAALVQKIKDSKKFLSSLSIVQLATRGAAQALHMENIIGSIEVNKKADLIIVNSQALHQVPNYNYSDQLVYSSKASDVLTVLINGKILYLDKQFVPEIEKQIEEIRRNIDILKIKL